ncbi:polymeric immunoglobulin receptor-like 2.4 [Danio rerio]|uniref:polymeric immunoglobulin receptor-like 2.4 n=1 Tax=Danio rerio TaxID=7955 RepID=UPI0003E9D45B|nr:polymeric immunoglobulin receptor-like 2.4 [Danio rerio]AHH83811.1 polymeric immunoglobulin receptor-like group 2-4 transcript variant 2 [Danio rerio]
MAAYATATILYISIGFWFILSADSYNEFSNHALTVQPGGSVTIPCHYNEQYTQLKKHCYLETDKYTNTREKNLLVIDHPDQSLFTVTMRNLRENQTGLYYCVVETGGTRTVIYEFYLKVQYVPDVSVMSSSVSGHEGDTVSVQCFYSSGYKNEQKQWCRYKNQKCFGEKKTDTSKSSSVQISDDGKSSFTVLMTGLRLSDSGRYFCSVGNQMIPVQLTVTHTESDRNNKDRDEKLSPVWFFALTPVLLISLILVGVFIFKWRRRPKQDEHQLKERNDSSTTDEISSKPDDLAVYCSINDETPYSISPLDPNKNMIYSTIDYIPGSEAKPPAGEDVYSSVGPH